MDYLFCLFICYRRKEAKEAEACGKELAQNLPVGSVHLSSLVSVGGLDAALVMARNCVKTKEIDHLNAQLLQAQAHNQELAASPTGKKAHIAKAYSAIVSVL